MTATLDALPLARRITEQAYKAGASLVTTLLADEESTLLRYRYASNASFDYAARGSMKAWPRHSGAAPRGSRSPATIPRCFRKRIPEKVSRANRAISKAYRPALELITRHDINWTIVAAATPAWAATVFPDLPPAKRWRVFGTPSSPRRASDHARSGGRVERTRLPTCTPRRAAERQALFGPALPRTRHRSPRRPRRRSPLARRRHHGGQRPLLHSQHADRRGLHHAAQRSRRKARSPAPSRSRTREP